MPEVFRYRGFKFFFYSNEGAPPEPVHIHVRKDGFEAKFWVVSEVSVAYNRGYSAATLRELSGIVAVNREAIVRAWYDHFSS